MDNESDQTGIQTARQCRAFRQRRDDGTTEQDGQPLGQTSGSG